MPDKPIRRSALRSVYRQGVFGDIRDGRPGLVIAERLGLHMVQLDAPARDSAFMGNAWKVLGFDLPRMANQTAGAGARVAYCLGPDRWLLSLPEGDARSVEAALAEALTQSRGALVPVGAGRTSLRLSGPATGAALARGCPLDLHARAFPAGTCAQTVIAGMSVLIHKLDEQPSYEVHVMRSFARHFWEWLIEASAQFGYRVAPPLTE